MTVSHVFGSVLVALSLGTSALAQVTSVTLADIPQSKKTEPEVPGGTLSGRVLFADTNGPARFAKVLLKPAESDAAQNDDLLNAMSEIGKNNKSKLSAEDQAQLKQQQAASARFLSTITERLLASTIAADGAYVFTNVKAGTYYVHAQAPGYVDPLSQFSDEDFASADPATRQRIAAAVPIITLNGTEQAHADLKLQRGASISGRVLFDDGTPAAGWVVRTVHAAAPAQGGPAISGIDLADIDLAHITETSTTDDTGAFRISGLPAGSYTLEARLTTSALGHSAFNPMTSNTGSPFASAGMAGLMGLKLTVYSGNALRRSAAAQITVGQGESRSGYDITMPLSTMHSIGGTVRAKSDSHPVNSGTVDLTLLDAQGNPDPSLHLTSNILPDGSFHFDYIPGQSNYTLKVAHAGDAVTTNTRKMLGSTIAEQKTTHSYGSVSQPVRLLDSDIPDLKVDVPELAPAGN